MLEQFRHAIELGIERGQFRVMDAKVAAFSIIGMCNWTAWWFTPAGPRKAEEIAEQIADMALRTVEQASGRQPGEPGAAGVIKLLREDIDLLERHLATERGKAAP